MLFQPLLHLSRLTRIFFLRVKRRRIHQCLDPSHHTAAKIDYAPDQRKSQNGILILNELQFVNL